MTSNPNNTQKTYVVRGSFNDVPFAVVADDVGNGRVVFCDWQKGDTRGSPTVFDTIDKAVRAKKTAERSIGNPYCAWVCVILPGGLELPLSSYSEKEEDIAAGHAALDPLIPRVDAKTNEPLLLSARVALAAHMLSEARAETCPPPVAHPAVDWLKELLWALQGMRSASLEGRHRLQDRVELLMADASDQGYVAAVLAMLKGRAAS